MRRSERRAVYLVVFLLGSTFVPLTVRSDILFASDRTGVFQIYSMRDDGTDVRQLTFGGRWSVNPRPSPDYRSIVFDSNREHVWDEIYMMDIDGGNIRLLVQGSSPSWSPSGNQLAVLAFHPIETGFWGVFIVDLGVEKPVLGRQIGDVVLVGGSSPSWFPDGSKIAVDGIQIVDVESGKSATVTPGRITSSNFGPSVSPDGTRIVFTSDFTSNQGRAGGLTHELFVVDADGSNLRQLTYGYTWAYFPAWSPDGRQIAFSSNRDGNREIYVMDADGQNVRNVTNHPANDKTPAWVPSAPVTPLSPVGKLPVLWGDVKRRNQ